jgi:glycerol-3-phosphate O-acyltransferase
MSALQGLLAQGGQCIWVAPSGGRDRPDPAAAAGSEFVVAPFDAKSVELFRLVAAKAAAAAKKTAAAALAAAAPAPPEGHPAAHAPVTKVFTLAMLTRKLVPPPADTGSRDVGEKRTARRGSVSIKFGGEITDAAAKASLPEGADKDTTRGAFAALAEAQVRRHFADLVAREKEVLGQI